MVRDRLVDIGFGGTFFFFWCVVGSLHFVELGHVEFIYHLETFHPIPILNSHSLHLLSFPYRLDEFAIHPGGMHSFFLYLRYDICTFLKFTIDIIPTTLLFPC